MIGPTGEKLLSIPQTAERLRVSLREVYDLIEAGDLRFVPPVAPGTIRVPDSAITEYLANRDPPDAE